MCLPDERTRRGVRTGTLYFLIAALLILADLWLLGRMSVQKDFSQYIFLEYQEGTVAETAFDSMMESDAKDIFRTAAVWKEDGTAEAVAQSTGKKQKLTSYQVKGQPEALFGRTLYAGRYFQSGETSVCLLDQKSARTLFGSGRAVGSKIILNGNPCQVTGILSGDRPVCIVPAGKGTMFDGIAVCRKKPEQSVKTSIGALEVYFGSAQGIIDGQFYDSIGRVLFSLNLAVLFFAVCVISSKCGRAGLPLEKWHKKRLFLLIGGILSLVILVQGIRYSGLGRDYLPTYWSDFEFYGSLWKEKAAAAAQFLAHQEFWHEQQMRKNWMLSVWGNLEVTVVQIVGTIIYLVGTRKELRM